MQVFPCGGHTGTPEGSLYPMDRAAAVQRGEIGAQSVRTDRDAGARLHKPICIRPQGSPDQLCTGTCAPRAERPAARGDLHKEAGHLCGLQIVCAEREQNPMRPVAVAFIRTWTQEPYVVKGWLGDIRVKTQRMRLHNPCMERHPDRPGAKPETANNRAAAGGTRRPGGACR